MLAEENLITISYLFHLSAFLFSSALYADLLYPSHTFPVEARSLMSNAPPRCAPISLESSRCSISKTESGYRRSDKFSKRATHTVARCAIRYLSSVSSILSVYLGTQFQRIRFCWLSGPASHRFFHEGEEKLGRGMIDEDHAVSTFQSNIISILLESPKWSM